MLKGLVQVDDHDDTGLNRNYEERHKPHPHCNAAIVAQRPLQEKAALHSVKSRENQDRRSSGGFENDAEQ